MYMDSSRENIWKFPWQDSKISVHGFFGWGGGGGGISSALICRDAAIKMFVIWAWGDRKSLLNGYSAIFKFMMTSLNGNISALLALFVGNSPGIGEFPSQRPVTRSFDVFFDLYQNKRLSKQSRRQWFESLSPSLWRRCDGFVHAGKT